MVFEAATTGEEDAQRMSKEKEWVEVGGVKISTYFKQPHEFCEHRSIERRVLVHNNLEPIGLPEGSEELVTDSGLELSSANPYDLKVILSIPSTNNRRGLVTPWIFRKTRKIIFIMFIMKILKMASHQQWLTCSRSSAWTLVVLPNIVFQLANSPRT